MANESQDSSELDEPDDFDAVLHAVARPPDVGDAVLEQISLPSTLDVPEAQLALSVQGAAEPHAGEVLDERYRIESVVGRGGMGVVYAARNLRTGKTMAIKWMDVGRRSAAVSTTMAERFRREARAAASIRHPNVVDVYDVGGPDAAPFLVMELLEGEAMSARIRRGALPFDEAARLMLGVMRGVSAAHRAGIVHRDLKPDNVFLCSSSDGGLSSPKVLDFGVAAIRDDSSDGLTSLTRSGAIIGTPAYMSPEQLTGKPTDERTDVYALGVMLFEALTGRLPFEARNAGELAVLQATRAPTRLSVLRPELFGACERLITRALAREPGDRFASVDEFARALEDVLAHPATVSVAAKKPGRVVLFVLALVLALALVGIYATRPASESVETPTVRVAREGEAPKAATPLPKPISPPPAQVPPEPTEAVGPAVDKAPRIATPDDVDKPSNLTIGAPRRRRPGNAESSAQKSLPAKTRTTDPSDKTRLSYDDF